ncbi:MAG: alpha/beta hydrolase, partial [Alphaproteobacteria bacterium]|nr:alpha/beta hydrolase [Alphaproteobacteria bacterium]
MTLSSRLATICAGLLVLVVAGCALDGNNGPPRIDEGAGRFLYKDPEAATGKQLRVWTYRPGKFTPDTPIVFVMHGNSRNADRYRDHWRHLADYYGLLVIAPEFSGRNFPGSWHYNLGNVMNRHDNVPTPKRDWAFPIVDRIFAVVQTMTKTRRKTFSLFGHSAGGQFVSRYMTFTPAKHVDLALVANPGWYTLPIFDEPFPYGLGGTAVTKDDLARLFASNFVLLLGDQDIQRTSKLRQTAEADRQGDNRFERGHTYFDMAKREAAAMGVAFDWRLIVVPGIG